ncbi:DHS-like NAD/FAD-binding domain-containing protein [Stachybotrys elegans]|uniref:DHS-like NAD/FAD-binding domain-containing protein n=1 Tax=Stachybotrys elegans TaxID=80388 RepID=A0A8K0SV99_9HYPO|nr:DHS-like NAD/FAD-binding domain-containing protein [Stachybotrys elegans]
MAQQTSGSESLADFHSALVEAKRIVAILGAGVSASSGLPTYTNNNKTRNLWRNYRGDQLATPLAFQHDPGLLWQYYSHMRHLALIAQPNVAHLALAELAKRVPEFVTLTQNIDNLSQRAGHPGDRLHELHGNLFNLRCCDVDCGYTEKGNFQDPLTPALATVNDPEPVTGSTDAAASTILARKATPWLLEGIVRKNKQILGQKYQDIAPTLADQAPLKTAQDESLESRIAMVSEPSWIPHESLPRCPKCSVNLLRPDIIWFGEALSETIVQQVDDIFNDPRPIDLFLVIGTSSTVWPAAGLPELARNKGARIAVINMDTENVRSLRPGVDWIFGGDASTLVPELLKPLLD